MVSSLNRPKAVSFSVLLESYLNLKIKNKNQNKKDLEVILKLLKKHTVAFKVLEEENLPCGWKAIIRDYKNNEFNIFSQELGTDARNLYSYGKNYVLFFSNGSCSIVVEEINLLL